VDDNGQRPAPVTRHRGARGLDLVLAVGAGAATLTRAPVLRPVGVTAGHARRLAGRVVPRASALPVVADLADRGAQVRRRLRDEAAEMLRSLLRRGVEAVLTAVDLTEVVLTHVDLDAVAAGIDVDAVTARADVDAVVARADLDAVVSRLDLDAIVARVDLDAIVERVDVDAVVGRVDLDAIVKRVDVDAVVGRVDLDRITAGIDVDQIAARVDVDRVARRIDLDAIVARVDPDAVVARVDVEAVIARLDLAGITREVIAAIDLAEVLRESTGVVSSQAARTVRTEGMNADESVSRFVDRLLRRPRPHGAVPT
jgi:hypothetical protein